MLLRAIPFAASLAALVLFAVVVRRLLTEFGQAIAVTAFALGCPFVYFGAQAKPYSTDVAVTLLPTWLLLRGFEKSRSIRYWLAYGAIAIAGCAVSHAAMLVVATHCVVLGWSYWRGQAPVSRAQFIAVQLLWIAGIAFSAWLSLTSISAADLAYSREVYSAWFVPSLEHDEALWLVRRIVDAFGLPRLRSRLDGGLRTRCRGSTPSSPSSASAFRGCGSDTSRWRYCFRSWRQSGVGPCECTNGRAAHCTVPILIVAAAAGWEFIGNVPRPHRHSSPWLVWAAALLFLAAPIAAIAKTSRPSTSNTFGPRPATFRHWQAGTTAVRVLRLGQAFRYAPRVGHRLRLCVGARAATQQMLCELDEFAAGAGCGPSSRMPPQTVPGLALHVTINQAGRGCAFGFAAAGEHAGMGAHAYLHDSAPGHQALVPKRSTVAEGMLRDDDALVVSRTSNKWERGPVQPSSIA